MKKLFIILILLAAHSHAFLQEPDLIWAGVLRNLSSFGIDAYEGGVIDTDSNLILTGHFSDGTDFDFQPPNSPMNPPSGYNQYDIFIQKISQSGQLIWVKAFGGSSNEFASSVTTDQNNNVIVTGTFNGTMDVDPGPGVVNLTSNSSSPNIFIVKLNTNGDFVWARSLDCSYVNEATSVHCDSNGDVLITGNFQQTINFNPSGSAQTFNSLGGYDGFILKMNSNGDYLWSKQYGGSGDDKIETITLNQVNEIVVGGTFEATFDSDPGPGTLTLSSNGGSDCFVQKLGASGNLIWSKSYGSATDDLITSISLKANAPVISGFFSSSADFDPGNGTYQLTPIGGNDIYLLNLDPSGAFLWAKSIEYSNQGFWDTPCYTAVNQNNEIYLSGPCAHDNVDLNPNSETFFLATNKPLIQGFFSGKEWINQFIIKFNEDGDFLNASSINSEGSTMLGPEFASSGLLVNNNRIVMFGRTSSYDGLLDLNIHPYFEDDYSTAYGNMQPSMFVTICSEFNDTIHYLNQDIDNIVGDTLRIHSIATARQSSSSGGYTLDGAFFSDSREKLLNPTNFGPSGTYPKTVDINDAFANSNDCINVTSLPVNDIFFFGSFNKEDNTLNQFTQQEIDSLHAWSLRGGKMIHTSFGDSAYIVTTQTFPNPPVLDTIEVDQNILGQKWNVSFVPSVPSYIVPTQEGMKTDLFREGPFGSVNAIFQRGDMQGHFESLSSNVQVYATDENGHPTLFMDCETLDLMAAEVDIFTNVGNISSGDGIYGAADRFWLNTIAFMDQLQELPVLSSSGGSLSLNDQYVSYAWYENNELVSTDENFSPYKGGDYHAIVTFNGGCQMSSNTVTLSDSVFLELNEVEEFQHMSIFPNPSNGVFTLKWDGTNHSNVKIEVMNSTGERLMYSEMMGNQTVLNMNGFSKGVYFVTLESNNRRSVKKLILN